MNRSGQLCLQRIDMGRRERRVEMSGKLGRKETESSGDKRKGRQRTGGRLAVGTQIDEDGTMSALMKIATHLDFYSWPLYGLSRGIFEVLMPFRF